MQSSTANIGDYVIGLYDYDAQDADEISFKEGQIMKVLQVDASGWWLVEKGGAESGFIPSNYVTKTAAPGSVPSTELTGVMLFDYDEDGEGEISVPAGASVKVVDDDDDAWVEVEYKGNKGRVPASFIKVSGTKAGKASSAAGESAGRSSWHFNDPDSSRWRQLMKNVKSVMILNEVDAGDETESILLEQEVVEMDQLLLAIDPDSATSWKLKDATFLDIPDWRIKFDDARKAQIQKVKSGRDSWKSLAGNKLIREHSMKAYQELADRMPWAVDHAESPVVAAFFPVSMSNFVKIIAQGFQKETEDPDADFGKGF
eukprot:TRINITY_DN13581_c0_g1_i1.p1 TRINITY_DN13581_c0_g1~~TRINITY_DN13581_c0_g1_i1.p1  ORF type:complete len:315 (+),score=60.23 TRINITY_DN13581_c0_g1_i1:166-1110(+)